MKTIANFFKAVFDFFVGDWIILMGVALSFVVIWLGLNVLSLNGFETQGCYLLFVGIILTLALSLYREVKPEKKLEK